MFIDKQRDFGRGHQYAMRLLTWSSVSDKTLDLDSSVDEYDGK